jgi:hypothetical protein
MAKSTPAAKPNGHTITSFKIPKSLHQRLRVAATMEDRKMHELVIDALVAYLGKSGGKPS